MARPFHMSPSELWEPESIKLTTSWDNILDEPLQNGFIVLDKRFSCAPTTSRAPVMKLINNKSSSRPTERHMENTLANKLLSPLPSTYRKPLPWINALNARETNASVLPLPVDPNINTWVRISSLLNQSSSPDSRLLPKNAMPRALRGFFYPGKGSF